MKPRSVLSSTAALTALVLCGTAGTASAAASTTPAAGSAASSVSLLSVQAAGHSLSIAGLQLVSDTLSGKPLAKVVVTPATVDGTAYGVQTITPDSSPVTVPGMATPSSLASLLSLSSPDIVAAATNAPSATAGATSLGALKVLGLPVALDGSLDVGSAVDAVTGAVATKSVSVQDLALPSIADLLAALGLDLSALPVGTLSDLVNQLDLANAAVDAAQAALTAAAADADAQVKALAAGNATLTAATTQLTGLLASVDKTAFPAASTLTGFLGLGSAQQTTVNDSTAGLAAALSNYNVASTAVATLNDLVDAAQALVATLTAALQTALSAVLDGTPLVSLASLTVETKALVTSAAKGGQTASITGGEISGLKVLGTDVLETALGSTSVDVLDLVGSASTTVSSTIAGLTGTLSSVLSNVPGLTGLTVPAPKVELLAKSTSTSIEGGFGKALASFTGLRISVPAIAVPSLAALPGAGSLPGLTAVTGGVLSAPIQLDLASLAEQSAFRPSVTTVGDPTSTPTALPRTGLPVGVAVFALLALGGAAVLRRRSAAE